MQYRAFRKIATGEFLNALFGSAVDTFDVPELTHRTEMAGALGLNVNELEVVESDNDPRSGTQIVLPVFRGDHFVGG